MQENDFLLDDLSDCSSGSIEVCCDDLTPGKTHMHKFPVPSKMCTYCTYCVQLASGCSEAKSPIGRYRHLPSRMVMDLQLQSHKWCQTGSARG